MDGHECVELLFSELENNFTIGAEYYSKEFVKIFNKLKLMNHTTLANASVLITDGDHGSPDYQDEGVLYLLSECIKPGYIDLSKAKYITEEKHEELKRSALHAGDVVVTKTGVYFGISAVIPEDFEECNTIAHVGKITLKEKYNPYVVSSFLNSKYGYYQMRRRGLKATRPEMKLIEMQDIVIPIFQSECLGAKLKEATQTGYRLLCDSRNAYKEAEHILIREIGIDMDKISSGGTSVKSFEECFKIQKRIDAEYYQLKNYEVIEQIKVVGTIGTLCNIYDKTFTPVAGESYQYIELANIGKVGDIDDVKEVLGEELPTRARRLVKKGHVMVSSIEGSLES